ncbi:unnamed protein product [Urochloa humidicola]
METGGYVSLEELEEYKYVTSQTFKREEDCYKFYNAYAKKKGFGVRKSNVRRNGMDEVIWRSYVCHSTGYSELKHFERTDPKRKPRALTRCGCRARLEVEWSESSAMWSVKKFVLCHTHPLAKPEHVFVLRSHRGLNDAQKAEAVEMGLGGLRTYEIYDVMEITHGGAGEAGFISKDLYNFFSREKKGKVEGSDAEFVLNHMRSMQKKDPEFFYTYTLDAEDRLENLFWSDAQSQIDYGAVAEPGFRSWVFPCNRKMPITKM